MTGGKLRSFVHIERPEDTQEPAGQGKIQWLPFTKAWGWFENMSATAAQSGQTIEQARSWRFHTRFREGIDKSMRLVYRGRVFDIQAILNPDERNEEVVLMVQEGLKPGG